MKKIALLFLLTLSWMEYSSAQLLTTPSGSVGNNVPPFSGIGIGNMTPSSTLDLVGPDVRFEKNNFRTGFKNTNPSSTFSSALGRDNDLLGTMHSIAMGNDNTIEGGEDCGALGKENIIGNSRQSAASGSGNLIDNSQSSFNFGTANFITGSTHSLNFGIQDTLIHTYASTILGRNSSIRESQASTSLGSENTIEVSEDCGTFGRSNRILESHYSFGIGAENYLFHNNHHSIAIGEENSIENGHASVSIGGHNENMGEYTYTIGAGLINHMPHTIMMGIGSPDPSLFIQQGSAGNAGNVGINTVNPNEKLHVNGTIRSDDLAPGGMIAANALGNIVLSSAYSGPWDFNCNDLTNVGTIDFCNGSSIDQNSPNELEVTTAMGIGILPSDPAVGISPGGSPAMLAVNGDIWAASGYWYASDKRFKDNINQLTSATEKIQLLNGYNYTYRQNEFPEINFQSGHSMGFIAQEVEEVFPELVRKGKDGYYSVNYMGVIPVLTEAIKEQQTQIEDKAETIETMQQEIADLKAAVASICNNGCGEIFGKKEVRHPSILDEVQLKQNQPNPYAGNTSIGFYLPEAIDDAALVIFDLQGKQVKRLPINDRGEGNVAVSAAELGNGIYLYGLLVDGQLTNTLKMVLAK